MGDFIQVLRWALRQTCPVRKGENWDDPNVALSDVMDLQHYSLDEKRHGDGCGIFDDVCVTSVADVPPENSKSELPYPEDGYVVSSKFEARGGIESLKRLCADCPANCTPGALAGCAGSFSR